MTAVIVAAGSIWLVCLYVASLQLVSELSCLKNCGNAVRSSSKWRIWNLQAGVLGILTPSSTRWATFHPSSSAFWQLP